MTRCIVCNRPAKWEHATKLAGNFPFCKKHARLEPDFKQEDAYNFWYKIQRKPLK